jgi:hypothetical protein
VLRLPRRLRRGQSLLQEQGVQTAGKLAEGGT